MMSVELAHTADMLDKIRTQPKLSKQLRRYSAIIREAVLRHTITSNGIFAYETNGYGGAYIMDDADVPSLVSFPYLGFLDRSDKTYQKTKEAMFSRANPYYAEGKTFNGIGYVRRLFSSSFSVHHHPFPLVFSHLAELRG